MDDRELAILKLSNLLEREFLRDAASATSSREHPEHLEAFSILSEPSASTVETAIVAWALALGKWLAVHALDTRVVQLVETKKQVARAKLLNRLVTLSPRDHDALARLIQSLDGIMKRLLVRLDHLDAAADVDASPSDPKRLMLVACAAAMTLAAVVHQHDKDSTMIIAVCKIITQAHAGVIAGQHEALKPE